MNLTRLVGLCILQKVVRSQFKASPGDAARSANFHHHSLLHRSSNQVGTAVGNGNFGMFPNHSGHTRKAPCHSPTDSRSHSRTFASCSGFPGPFALLCAWQPPRFCFSGYPDHCSETFSSEYPDNLGGSPKLAGCFLQKQFCLFGFKNQNSSKTRLLMSLK